MVLHDAQPGVPRPRIWFEDQERYADDLAAIDTLIRCLRADFRAVLDALIASQEAVPRGNGEYWLVPADATQCLGSIVRYDERTGELEEIAVIVFAKSATAYCNDNHGKQTHEDECAFCRPAAPDRFKWRCLY